ncbi:hypothetical Protein YC6258_00363 [Gynuella sunshinyii YC6258]|uniref:Uncharacterized protein n=1 Tax=Gynuella sunshinyii YC6258 TaxID=1445510 RepID=A0A0C5VG73_9GAMM|nr:hypothetical Protein YC6258_00363 [Gynuella sunshinyii YC6258]
MRPDMDYIVIEKTAAYIDSNAIFFKNLSCLIFIFSHKYLIYKHFIENIELCEY